MYSLPEFTPEENTIRLLAFDPGSKNMGISVVSLDKKTLRIKVIANSTMTYPVNNIKKIMEQRKYFINEVNSWIKRFSPMGIIAERFQSRGLRGATVECVCIMLGMLLERKLPVVYITASTWKNKYQRRFCVNLRDLYKKIPTTPHQLDSCLIGCYGLELCAKKDLSFSLEEIINHASNTSLVALRKGKKYENARRLG